MTETETPLECTFPLASREAFRDGMAHLAGAVNIVTTDGPAGKAGFTATAVCSVTDSPPTLLVCVNRASSAAGAFLKNDAVCVNAIGPEHVGLAITFGGKTPMADRFSGAEWLTRASGAPNLVQASVAFDCTVRARSSVGTHDVLFCEVRSVTRGQAATASVYYARKFYELEA